MKILALEPFYSGSHRYFIDGLITGSKHEWDLYTLSGNTWRWRMRHSAIYFAEKIKQEGKDFDLIFCTSMVNVAELRGMLPQRYRNVPIVVYFHENRWHIRFTDRPFQQARSWITLSLPLLLIASFLIRNGTAIQCWTV